MTKKKRPVGRPRKPTDEEVQEVAENVRKTVVHSMMCYAYSYRMDDLHDLMDRDEKFIERVETELLRTLLDRLGDL